MLPLGVAMPLYEYRCECGKQFESVRSIDNRHNAMCKCGNIAKLKVSSWGRVIIASFFTVVRDGKILEKKQITERTPYRDSNGRDF